MTCQDCIHYKSIGTLCDKFIYPEERNNEPCDFFINNDGTTERDCPSFMPIEDSWESVSK